MCLPDRHIESASSESESVLEPSFSSSQSMHPGLRPRRLATLLRSERAGTPLLSAIVVDPPSLKAKFLEMKIQFQYLSLYLRIDR